MFRTFSLSIDTDYKNHRINMKFSKNLTDDRERGYILSAAFFSFCAAQGLSKKEVIEMISSNYDQFLNDK
ncbi:hypothetical protein GJR85_00715 [Lactobacillus acetotolerans]|nr:hypothetical protein GJR85_00715 [Lactobacillus acetotolerans]